MKEFQVLDDGDTRPYSTRLRPFPCFECDERALLPIAGLPMGSTSDGGVIFDLGEKWMPRAFRCPSCRQTFERETA